MGAFRWADSCVDSAGNNEYMGMFPWIHEGIPWGFHHDDIKDGELNGQVIIITGGNTGLGFSSASYLVSKGAHVVLGCRSQKKCESAAQKINNNVEENNDGGVAVPMIIDLSSFVSIKKFADEFLERYQKLDSLMLNAGIMMTDFGFTEQGLESQMGVNHFGHFYLTHLLLPILRSSSSPSHPTTITSVSSSEHLHTYSHGMGLDLETLNDESKYHRRHAYGQSKMANVLFALKLAEKEKERGSNVLVNVVHPGGVRTDLERHITEFLSKQLGLPSCVGAFAFESMSYTFWDSDDACLSQVYTSFGPKLLKEKITGEYFHPIARIAVPHVKFAKDQRLQNGLWELSEEVVAKFEREIGVQ